MAADACSVGDARRYAPDLVVHMGYDAWHQNEKLVLPLQQLPPDEACARDAHPDHNLHKFKHGMR